MQSAGVITGAKPTASLQSSSPLRERSDHVETPMESEIQVRVSPNLLSSPAPPEANRSYLNKATGPTHSKTNPSCFNNQSGSPPPPQTRKTGLCPSEKTRTFQNESARVRSRRHHTNKAMHNQVLSTQAAGASGL